MRLALCLSVLIAAGLAFTAPDPYEDARGRMVDLVERYGHGVGVSDPRVLAAMRKVPRHEFVDPRWGEEAYADTVLPIGWGQTMSQPLVVGYMTQLLELQPGDKVLEVGTGSGYQAAVLAELGAKVYTIEIIPELAERARQTLKRLGYGDVSVRAGDGYRGWPEAAPFDAVIVTCAPERVPQPLAAQLKVGGRMVIPVGPRILGFLSAQDLLVLHKTSVGLTSSKRMDVRFVPMRGQAEKP